jgi:hypothetical protein
LLACSSFGGVATNDRPLHVAYPSTIGLNIYWLHAFFIHRIEVWKQSSVCFADVRLFDLVCLFEGGRIMALDYRLLVCDRTKPVMSGFFLPCDYAVSQKQA